jgi:ribosomal-protein-alanine N-acetyltransferase
MMRSSRVAELGYSLSREYWGKGIMTRLIKTVMSVSFKELKLHKIFARCNPENKGSEKVMKNVGMKYEAYMREHEEIKGEFWDLIQYGILRREFK